jgi:hypothetical protein
MPTVLIPPSGGIAISSGSTKTQVLPSGGMLSEVGAATSDLSGNVALDDVVAAGSMGSSASDISGGVTLDDAVAAGAMGGAGASGLSGGVTLDPAAAAGTLGQQSGTCVVPALKNWNGSLQTSVTVPWVTFCRLTDAVQVLILANQVTHATTADLSVTNVALATGTWYMALGFDADGSQRFARPVLAA